MTEALKTDWPSDPYKGLAHYGPDDRPLFTGRDEDVDACIHFLAAPETRILLLHGQTGCGKSSFLRAGLIPSLEERAFGYLFLRDAAGAPLFIRCGPDPVGRIAEHLFRFASQPVSVESVRGSRLYDVSDACLGNKELKDYVEACRRPGVLLHSLQMLAKTLPYTLVIIVDQAEEVITLAERKSNYRREFFRFVREFSTTNFPLKFVLALRKDNSGEFIGLAQIGGSLELPALPDETTPVPVSRPPTNGREPAAGESWDRPVKSDIKIFLLSELTRDEVLKAIVQPTLKTPVDGRTPPYQTYEFDYAPGVAEEIVQDIFEATSSTAVLPVMQIVCRDLYNGATTENSDAALSLAERRKRPKPWRIDQTLYTTGGRIQGPVDRHVSRSLIASFGGMVPDSQVKAEELRWREILFGLVRRESDGTVHTDIVSMAKLRAIADKVQPVAKVDTVVEYLTRPEVLLLRSVTILSADDPEEGRWFSLGHDFIGMVLQHWKVRQEELEATHRRIMRVAKTAGWATLATAAVVGSVVYVGYRASEHGKAESKHQVLVNSAKFKQREDPMFALLAAAQASRVADELSKDRLWLGSKPRDAEADVLLANMLAGLPKTIEFPASAAPSPATDALAGIDRNMPLPKARGYVVFDAARAEIVTDVAGNPKRAKFELDAMPAEPAPVAAEPSVAIDEPKPGTVLLMRTLNRSQFQDLAFSTHQLYVFTPDGKLGPFNADYFQHFADSGYSEPSVPPPSKRGGKLQGAANAFEDPTRFAREGFTWIDLSGGVVVLYKFKPPPGPGGRGSLTIDSFVFDERKTPKPFRRGFVSQRPMDRSPVLEYEPNPAFGLNAPMLLDGYLLVPEPRGVGKNADLPARIVRYDLRRPKNSDGQQAELKELTDKLACAPERPCQWQIIQRREPGSLILFGALRSSAQLGQRSLEQLNQADLESFERFVIGDVVNGHAIAVEGADLRTALDACATRRVDTATGGAAPQKASTKLFISGTVESLLVGFPTAHAVDLVRIAGSTAPQCIGTLMVPPDLNQWSLSADASLLLGAGPNAGAMWDVRQPVKERAKQLLTSSPKDTQGVPTRLVRLACAAGLKDYQPSRDLWMATTYLDQAPSVCGGAVPAPAGTAASATGNAP